METKRCFKCLCEKPLDAFYKHAAMAGGRLNKCKECTKKDVSEHRKNNLEKVRAYDKLRASVPHRVAARREYIQTEAGKLAKARAMRKQRELHPEKYAARMKARNAVVSGKLIKTPCIVCGNKTVDGHHPDYSRPLDVVWLCKLHHKEVHDLVKQEEFV